METPERLERWNEPLHSLHFGCAGSYFCLDPYPKNQSAPLAHARPVSRFCGGVCLINGLIGGIVGSSCLFLGIGAASFFE